MAFVEAPQFGKPRKTVLPWTAESPLAQVVSGIGYNCCMSNSRQPSPELPSLSTSLLDRVQQMEPDAWARLVTVFSPIVYRWCRQSGLIAQDATDVVQEVFSSVARGIGNFERAKKEGSFRSWLATITRNRIRDHHRCGVKQPFATGGTDAQLQWNELPESFDASLEHSVSEASMNDLLPRRVLDLVQAEFEPMTWQAFWLTTVDGKSAGEVAEQLSLNVASVYQAKSRVLRRFRQRLGELP